MHAPLERLHEQLDFFIYEVFVQNVLIILNQILYLDSDKKNPLQEWHKVQIHEMHLISYNFLFLICA